MKTKIVAALAAACMMLIGTGTAFAADDAGGQWSVYEFQAQRAETPESETLYLVCSPHGDTGTDQILEDIHQFLTIYNAKRGAWFDTSAEIVPEQRALDQVPEAIRRTIPD